MRRSTKSQFQPSAALIAVLVTLVSSYAQKETEISPVRIEISVGADNGLDRIIRGYLTRSFREVKNIVITDAAPDYKIGCVAVAFTPEGGPPGCALSFVVLNNTDALLLLDSYINHNQSIPESLYTVLPNQYKALDHLIRTVQRDHLQQACAEFVASFEGDHLDQLARNFINYLHESLDKRLRGGKQSGEQQ
jgi:hypothetical protein